MKKIKALFRIKILFTAWLFLFSVSSFTQSYTVIKDIDYTGNHNRFQYLDVYLQDDAETPAPLIVHIHGGAFRAGSKGAALRNCDSLFRNGYVIADLNYRLSGDTIFPAAIHDCKTAIRYLKLNCEKYGIDSSRIGLVGESAGGYLVTMLGTTIGVDEFEGLHLGSNGTIATAQAVCDFYGPTDFSKLDTNTPVHCRHAMIHLGTESPESLFLGCKILEDCPELVQKANPLNYIDGSEPPFLIYHGAMDCTVNAYQSILLHEKLDEYNVVNELKVVENKKHGDEYFNSAEIQSEMRKFFDAVLK